MDLTTTRLFSMDDFRREGAALLESSGRLLELLFLSCFRTPRSFPEASSLRPPSPRRYSLPPQRPAATRRLSECILSWRRGLINLVSDIALGHALLEKAARPGVGQQALRFA